jgi:hypothetical protein
MCQFDLCRTRRWIKREVPCSMMFHGCGYTDTHDEWDHLIAYDSRKYMHIYIYMPYMPEWFTLADLVERNRKHNTRRLGAGCFFDWAWFFALLQAPRIGKTELLRHLVRHLSRRLYAFLHVEDLETWPGRQMAKPCWMWMSDAWVVVAKHKQSFQDGLIMPDSRSSSLV